MVIPCRLLCPLILIRIKMPPVAVSHVIDVSAGMYGSARPEPLPVRFINSEGSANGT